MDMPERSRLGSLTTDFIQEICMVKRWVESVVTRAEARWSLTLGVGLLGVVLGDTLSTGTGIQNGSISLVKWLVNGAQGYERTLLGAACKLSLFAK